MRLKDKVAIITGAASGMGAADARLFAKEGAKVVIADVLDADGKALADELAAAGHTAVFHSLDVTDPNSWKQIVHDAVSSFGKLDILVNNAGITGAGVEDVCDLDLFDRIIAVNLRGVFLGIRAAVPHMMERGGSIVNMSSISGMVGNLGVHIGYNASKGGVRAITKAAAATYGGNNIRVNSVHPGMLPPMRNKVAHSLSEKGMIRVPLGRSGKVHEVAAAVLFLASDEASYISGAELCVDGGFLAA
jgi:NAD(P)-dependent dehydrogenase (short-subunit alcohol dehydrogenase family)